MPKEGAPPSGRGPGPSTRSVHGGERGRLPSEAVTTPIYQTSTFWFRDSAELREYQEGRRAREEYGRYGNPTWKAVERKLCELEGAEAAVLFASGMCAATTLFLALLPRGGHLVVTSDCYRRRRRLRDPQRDQVHGRPQRPAGGRGARFRGARRAGAERVRRARRRDRRP